jgi:hypothetical protein
LISLLLFWHSRFLVPLAKDPCQTDGGGKHAENQDDLIFCFIGELSALSALK